MTAPQLSVGPPNSGPSIPVEVRIPKGEKLPWYNPGNDNSPEPDYELMMGEDFPA